MLYKALLSAAIMLCIPIISILTEVLIRKFFHTHSTEAIYCILPISEKTTDIEIKLISITKSLETVCQANFTVFIVDFGANENTLSICEKYCNDNNCFVLIEPQALSVLLTYDI
ncbi:MAG: hypothetical protein IJO29_09620 [Oscillospiraceae bacterium]|nr:hypothetical protein [Oscillospiraceae bacterium]